MENKREQPDYAMSVYEIDCRLWTFAELYGFEYNYMLLSAV